MVGRVMAGKKKLEELLTTPVPRTPPVEPGRLLGTGSTALNLALSGCADGALRPGDYLFIVGDSGGLKTWLSMSLFAEACRNPYYDRYSLVYDDTENGAGMSIPQYFGKKAAMRIVPTAGTIDEPECSENVESFYFNVDRWLDSGPVLYVLDSMDSLTTEDDDEQFEAARKKHETGEGKVPNSYGTAKAKENSRNINRVVKRLRDTGSILVVISQTRDKIGGHIPGLRTRSGGKALRFYSHVECWTRVVETLKKTRHGIVREYGKLVEVDVQKNRVNGWEGKVEIPFIKGVGIDDVGSLVSFLVQEKVWKGKEGNYSAPEFKVTGDEETIVKAVLSQDGEPLLRQLAEKAWHAMVAAVTPERKMRYE